MNTPQDSTYRPSARGQASGSSGGTHARDSAEDLAEKARAEGQEHVQHYRDAAADKVDTFADSVKAAASELKDDDVAHLSGHISDMANGLGRLADGLREKSADDILRDVRRVARDNPTLFIAGSIAIGFGIARFARASSAPDSDQPGSSASSGRSSASHRQSSVASERTATRWTDPDSAVPGTAARPATGNDTVDTIAPDDLIGAIPAAPGPSASTADAISARAGAAASDPTTGGRSTPSSTDTPRGRT